MDLFYRLRSGKNNKLLYFVNKVFSLMLGVVMVVAFVAQYPYVSTRTYSTFSIPVPYTIQYIPMALAGAYMALKSVEQLVEEILKLAGKLPDEA